MSTRKHFKNQEKKFFYTYLFKNQSQGKIILSVTLPLQAVTANHRTSCNFHKMFRKMKLMYGITLFISPALQLLESPILH